MPKCEHVCRFHPISCVRTCTFADFFFSLLLLLLLLLNAELLMVMLLQQAASSFSPFVTISSFFIIIFVVCIGNRAPSVKIINDPIYYCMYVLCCVCMCMCAYIIYPFDIYVRDLDITDLCCIQFLHTKCRWIYISAVALAFAFLFFIFEFRSFEFLVLIVPFFRLFVCSFVCLKHTKLCVGNNNNNNNIYEVIGSFKCDSCVGSQTVDVKRSKDSHSTDIRSERVRKRAKQE